MSGSFFLRTLSSKNLICFIFPDPHYYQHHTKDIPLLAPLLDKMVTRDINNRFTAEEALQFVERILIEAEPAQLSVVERPNPFRGIFTYETYDRWQGLPIDFQRGLAAYREPVGVPLISRALRAIIRSNIFPRSTVPTIRWLFFRITSVPRMVGEQLLKCYH